MNFHVILEGAAFLPVVSVFVFIYNSALNASYWETHTEADLFTNLYLILTNKYTNYENWYPSLNNLRGYYNSSNCSKRLRGSLSEVKVNKATEQSHLNDTAFWFLRTNMIIWRSSNSSRCFDQENCRDYSDLRGVVTILFTLNPLFF